MPKPVDYDMTAVRTAYGNLKARLANAKKEKDDAESDGESPQYHAYARGKITGYEYVIECFLVIFGPTLEE
jgi:hypothetical protein